MKTIDSVMRESEIELLEKTVEDIMVESSCEPDGERLWVKTSYELADLCRPIISHSLAEARREERERVLQEIGNVASAGNVGEQTKLSFKWLILELESRWHKSDLLTGDNPERKV